MTKRIVIAGASGFIGSHLIERWRGEGHTVQTIGRGTTADARWGDAAAITALVNGSDLLVNLAGKSVNCRYNDENRAAILESRISTTSALRQAVQSAKQPPPLWVNASTGTTYLHTTERANHESAPTGETGFSEDVARAWEAALLTGETPGTRRIPMRLTIVLGNGAAPKMLFTLARLGIGGTNYDSPWLKHSRYRGLGARKGTEAAQQPSEYRLTHGEQMFSWIHVSDVARAIEHLAAHPEIDGPVNFASPNAAPNSEFMAMLRKTVGMPIGIPSWRWMLEPAMWALRTESELVLKSRWVYPGVLAATGFEFEHTELEPTLAYVWQELREGSH